MTLIFDLLTFSHLRNLLGKGYISVNFRLAVEFFILDLRNRYETVGQTHRQMTRPRRDAQSVRIKGAAYLSYYYFYDGHIARVIAWHVLRETFRQTITDFNDICNKNQDNRLRGRYDTHQ